MFLQVESSQNVDIHSGTVMVTIIKALRASTAELSIDQMKAPTNLAVMIWCSETGKVKVR